MSLTSYRAAPPRARCMRARIPIDLSLRRQLRRTNKPVRRSVSRVLSVKQDGTAIHLGRSLLSASRDPPGRRRTDAPVSSQEETRRPYSVLLPAGLAVPPSLRSGRWALTPPFHLYRDVPGSLLSAALSLGSLRAGVTRRRVCVEPGLSSPAPFPALRERPSDRLTDQQNRPQRPPLRASSAAGAR